MRIIFYILPFTLGVCGCTTSTTSSNRTSSTAVWWGGGCAGVCRIITTRGKCNLLAG